MPSNTIDPAALAEAHRRLAELDRAVDETRSALSRLRACLPPTCVPEQRVGLIEIPDAPYDPAMWQGAEDEGIGGHHH
ncbi:hypothetical protein [Streptacidiphilus jiangxiensis]|uniref:Uncharacterized protein n=1 Tax=Streptacidiphilus jiangxiensis TaxID=235985 RepID=A0A1H7FPH3_STRJI|nr:hypothetical protein [Streptacidiphilus jiangxiensis]SEK27869.1 hypothetical protein SAMN05414137_101349 [Streptacidiphilus jiangxiensis]